MDWLVGAHWRDAFSFHTAVSEIVVRGTVMYLALYALMRVVLKRQAGTVGVSDLLLVVLLADAAQNAMAADYVGIPDGLVLVVTILFWSYALDWISFNFPGIAHWIQPRPLLLVKDGVMLPSNMRKELITREELMSHLREEGVDDVSRVKKAFMEGDGRISVITDDEDSRGAPPRRVV